MGRFCNEISIVEKMLPDEIYRDNNKLILRVQSKSNPAKTHDVTITRDPPRVFCDCVGAQVHKYCHHMKELKGYTDGFIKGKEKLDPDIGKVVKADVFHSMSEAELGEKQQLVYDCLFEHPDGLNDKGIAMLTNLSLSSVCGRRNELLHMGKVIPYTIHTYDDESGKCVPNIIWGINK